MTQRARNSEVMNQRAQKNDAMTTTDPKIKLIIEALQKVDPQINAMIVDSSKRMTINETVKLFNQTIIDFFNLVIDISIEMNKEKECGFGAYKKLFELGVKANVSLPIEKFLRVILLVASDIYSENEEEILGMKIPDLKIDTEHEIANAGSNFNLLQSDQFKKLWVQLNNFNKEKLKEKIVSLTTYSHIYFYQSIMFC